MTILAFVFTVGRATHAQGADQIQLTNMFNVYSPWPMYQAEYGGTQLYLYFGGDDTTNQPIGDQIYKARCSSPFSCESYSLIISRSMFPAGFQHANDPSLIANDNANTYIMFMTVGINGSNEIWFSKAPKSNTDPGLWSTPQPFLSGWAYPSVLQDPLGNLWLYARDRTGAYGGVVWRFSIGFDGNGDPTINSGAPIDTRAGQPGASQYNVNPGYYPYSSVIYVPPTNGNGSFYIMYGQGGLYSIGNNQYPSSAVDLLTSVDGINWAYSTSNGNLVPEALQLPYYTDYSPVSLPGNPCIIYYGLGNQQQFYNENVPYVNIYVRNWCSPGSVPTGGSVLYPH